MSRTGVPPPASSSGYSGITTYVSPKRSDSITRNTNAKPALNSPEEIAQSKETARVHYSQLKQYLESEGIKDPTARANAREKLSRLTRQQFAELSTDVFDELSRRLAPQAIDCLPKKDDYHPKRNQARQKLSTLPKPKFKDLASDCYFELERRYPEFSQPERPPSNASTRGALATASQQRPRPTLHHSNPSTSTINPTSTANDIIIPNKSTLVEEDISVSPPPSGDARQSPHFSIHSDRNDGTLSPPFSIGPLGSGLSSISEQEREESSPTPTSAHPYNTSAPVSAKDSRMSETSSIGARFIGQYTASPTASTPASRTPANWEEDRQNEIRKETDKIKTEYEYKVATMQTRTAALEKELDSAKAQVKAKEELESKNRKLENDLNAIRQRYDEQSEQIETLQNEIEQLRAESASYRATQSESLDLRNQIESLEQQNSESSQVTQDLRHKMDDLVGELKSMMDKMEVMEQNAEKDKDELEKAKAEIEEWKTKYRNAKSKNGVRAPSQILVSSPRTDEYNQPSSGGIIPDSHVTAFQGAIDHLLMTARSPDAVSVLSALKRVLAAVSTISTDITSSTSYDSLPEATAERLSNLQERTNAVLSNLIVACKTHAQSQGLSPVSLVDAAASHVSDTVVELILCVGSRKIENGLANDFRGLGISPTEDRSISPNWKSPLSASTREERPRHSPTNFRPATAPPERTASPLNRSVERIIPSPSSWQPEYPPDTPQAPEEPEFPQEEEEWRDDHPEIDEGMDLKSYLDGQTEAIVHSMQSLLAAIRSGSPSSEISDHLTQIITIVTSIVAITRASLQPSTPLTNSAETYLVELSDNCDKLSEMLASGTHGYPKSVKQQLATASFGVAKSLKALTRLVGENEE